MDVAEHWRLRLIELKDDLRLTQASLAIKLEKSPDYVSRLLYEPNKKGRKNLGLQTIRTAIKNFDLEPGWFDQPLGTALPSERRSQFEDREAPAVATLTPWPFRRVSPAQYAKLSRAQRDHIEETILMILPPSADHGTTLKGHA